MTTENVEYVGPYENWVFNDGRPYTFPSLRDVDPTHLTALASDLVFTGQLPPSFDKDNQPITPVLPPLWSDANLTAHFVPFAFEVPTGGSGSTGTTQQVYFRSNLPVDENAWAANYAPNTVPNNWVIANSISAGSENLVIIGIIEDAMPFAHKSLLDSEGKTRMDFCWLQSAAAIGGQSAVPFGREYTNTDIDNLRATYTDEDELYEKSGAISAALPELGVNLRRGATHGAHILTAASGLGGGIIPDVMADNIRIISVQLPNTIAWDTSGFGKDMYMLSAVHYIMNRAKHIASQYNNGVLAEVPLAINFSYGWSASRHDGNGYLEAAIGELVTARRQTAPTAMVIPTGNTLDEDLHGLITTDKFVNDEFSFAWKIQPDDRTSSYLEIWFPDDVNDQDFDIILSHSHATITPNPLIISLHHDPALSGDLLRRFKKIEINGQVIGQLSVDKHRNSRWRCLITLAPSDVSALGGTAAPPGKWNVTVKRNAAAQTSQAIQVWVQRDDDPAELKTGGRQSYLVDLDPPLPPPNPRAKPTYGKGFLQAFGSLSGVSNHQTTTLVAGFDGVSQQAAFYSSAGSLVKNGGNLAIVEKAVTCAAISERSGFLGGVLAGGVKSGSLSTLSGTSSAAPLATRELAKAFANLTTNAYTPPTTDNYLSLLSGSSTATDTIETRARLGHKRLQNSYIKQP